MKLLRKYFVKFLRTPYSQNTSGRVLLNHVSQTTCKPDVIFLYDEKSFRKLIIDVCFFIGIFLATSMSYLHNWIMILDILHVYFRENLLSRNFVTFITFIILLYVSFLCNINLFLSALNYLLCNIKLFIYIYTKWSKNLFYNCRSLVWRTVLVKIKKISFMASTLIFVRHQSIFRAIPNIFNRYNI